MIGLVMAGGSGSRMKLSQEKLLLKYKKPIVLHVLDAMLCSKCFSDVFVATSPNAPQTKKLVTEKKYDLIETPGENYVADLNLALQDIDEPVFVTPADLPLLDGSIIRQIARQHDPNFVWTSILVTDKFLDSMGFSSGFGTICDNQPCSYTGIHMVDSAKIHNVEVMPERLLVIDDRRIALNLNTLHDYDLLGTV